MVLIKARIAHWWLINLLRLTQYTLSLQIQPLVRKHYVRLI